VLDLNTFEFGDQAGTRLTFYTPISQAHSGLKLKGLGDLSTSR
jgi:hypothetical protein